MDTRRREESLFVRCSTIKTVFWWKTHYPDHRPPKDKDDSKRLEWREDTDSDISGDFTYEEPLFNTHEGQGGH